MFLKFFEGLGQVSHPEERDFRAAGDPGDCVCDSNGVFARSDDGVNSRAVSSAKTGAEVMRVLNAIEDKEERILGLGDDLGEVKLAEFDIPFCRRVFVFPRRILARSSSQCARFLIINFNAQILR